MGAAKFLKPGTRAADVYPALERTYSDDQPRVPGGESGGGQWTSGGGGSSSGRPRVHIYRSDPESNDVGDAGSSLSLPDFSFDLGSLLRDIDWSDLFDIKPRAGRTGGVRLAGDVPDRLQIPDDQPPKIPKKKPKRSALRTATLRTVANYLVRNRRTAIHILSGFMNHAEWLKDYQDVILANRDPPKTMQELRAGVGKRRPGYDTHHIIEQTAAEYWGLTRSEIDDPSNLVSIPRLRHYQITGWYGTKNDKFNGLSPRDYLIDKGLEERRKVGIEALIDFKVLKP